MADKVLIEYEVNINGFDAAIAQVTKGAQDVDKATKSAQQSTQQLSGSVGTLSDKYATLAEEEAAAAQAAADLAAAQKNATSSTQQLASSATKTNTVFQGWGKTFAGLANSVKSGVGAAVKGVGSLGQVASGISSKISSVGGATGKAFSAIGGGITNIAGRLPVVGGLATALGPVGIAAGAVAGGLLSIVKNTDAGATALDGLGRTGGLIFDRVTGAAKDFFDALTSGTGIIGGAFDAISAGVDFFINKLTPIGAIIESIGNTSFFQGIKEDFKEGQRIAQLYDNLDEQQRKSITTIAELDAKYRKLNVQLRDRTKTDQERLAIADQLTATETERAKVEGEVLAATTAAIREEVKAAKARNEVSDELDRRLRDAEAAEIEASAASVERLEKAENRKNAILEGAEAKRNAAREKAAAAQEKRDADAAKRAEIRAQAEAKLDGVVDELARGAVDRTLTESQRELQAVNDKYDALVQTTQEGAEQLREASAPGDQSAITQREADTLIKIDEERAKEVAEITARQQQEALDQIKQFTLSRTELERQAALDRQDELIKLAEEGITDETERAAVIEEITRKTQEQLTTIVTDEEQKRLDAQKAAAEQAIAIGEQVKTAEVELKQARIDAAAAGVDIVTKLAGETEEAQAVALAAQKAAAVANVVIQTQAAIAAATAALAAISPVLPPGVPNPAYPAAVALNAATIAKLKIQAGISIATILAQTIAGAYTGEERVGRNEAPALPGTKDRYLRRVHKDEGIVDARTNMEHLDAINAMRRGTFDAWVAANYAPLIGDDDRMVRYVNSDMGQRMATSITLPRMFDKGIVGGIARSRKEQQVTNELLSALVANTSRRRTNPRYN
jgi:hypothetical protein